MDSMDDFEFVLVLGDDRKQLKHLHLSLNKKSILIIYAFSHFNNMPK